MTKLPDGWEIKHLEDLCEPGKQAIVDGPFGSNLKRSDYVDSGIPVLKIQNVKENVITLKKMDYVKPEKYEELLRHSFAEDDIVMTKLGDPLGVSAIVYGIPNGLIVADLVRIRPSKILTKFLCYQLNSPRIREYINEQQKGTTRPRVNIAMIRELPIYSPPLPEQQKIVGLLEDHLSRLDAALADVKQVKVKAAQFRRSLLQAAFTGNLSGDSTRLMIELPVGWEIKRLGDCLEQLKSGKKAERGWSPQCLSNPSPDENV
jgi:type I restriction enzyme S subunit